MRLIKALEIITSEPFDRWLDIAILAKTFFFSPKKVNTKAAGSTCLGRRYEEIWAWLRPLSCQNNHEFS
jgi:hypothetical protein